ncbi:MAG: tetratricopeptide repeat-containing protein [Planctomycetia bacterium]
MSIAPPAAEIPELEPTAAVRWSEAELARDLRHLDDVYAVAAWDGAVFYAARIMEGLAASASLHSSTLVALLAEKLLDRSPTAAEPVLDRGLADFPHDFRLRQLQGLFFSRSGDLQKAAAVLEPLHKRHRTDYETTGMLAAVYKKQSQRPDGAFDPVRLKRSFELYKEGWDHSRKNAGTQHDRGNTYLGINAATTARLLGRDQEAAAIAADVMQALRHRATAVEKGGPTARLEFWTEATLAEAELLNGDFAAARTRYRRLRDDHPDRADAVKIAHTQAEKLWKSLKPDAGESFL